MTTPQRLALVDVVKGVEMFTQLNVPTLAIVENMAYFDSPSDGVRGNGSQINRDRAKTRSLCTAPQS